MRRSGRLFPLVALLWALFGWLHGTQLFLGIRAETSDSRYTYPRIVLWEIGCWLIWAALTPAVVWLSRRVPLTRQARPILLHLLAGAALAPLHVAGVTLLSSLVQPFGPSERSWGADYLGSLSSYFHLDLLVYWAIVGVTHAIDSQRRLRERELQASRVETQLVEARLANLRLQLQPHFLFNTLHAIASLVRDGEGGKAVAMIAGLSDLLRASLDSAGRPLVPLLEELDLVSRYLEIQQARFSDRLAVAVYLAEETRDAVVPTMLLQPLVENAIRHGLAASAEGGRLEILARREGADLVLEVHNDGAPLPDGWRRRAGVGLASTEGRLAQLYGPAARLELENSPSSGPPGVVARVRLPFSRELPGAR